MIVQLQNGLQHLNSVIWFCILVVSNGTWWQECWKSLLSSFYTAYNGTWYCTHAYLLQTLAKILLHLANSRNDNFSHSLLGLNPVPAHERGILYVRHSYHWRHGNSDLICSRWYKSSGQCWTGCLSHPAAWCWRLINSDRSIKILIVNSLLGLMPDFDCQEERVGI